MFNNKVCLALAALLMVAIMVGTASADDPCEDCLGDSMVALIDKFAEKRDCWFNTKHHVILKLKIANLIALIENFQAMHELNNDNVPATCKSEVTLKECDMKDRDLLSICLLDNLKSVVVNYHDQEQCNGKPLQSELLRIAIKLLFGSFAGWDQIHPDC